ncbi:MAG: alpha/beta fold hydrolase [candidate division Zixibacteria bacterium]|nr:alpha/beta fold hydrolase [candidate division Zixibacteria bacterium]
MYNNNDSNSHKRFAGGTIFILFVLMLIGCGSQKGSDGDVGKIAVNGIEIYHKTVGAGTPTFVLHGGPGDTYETMIQMQSLADEYKVIFYDQRATGRSTGDEDTASHTVEQFVEDLEQLRLKFGGGKVNVIGGSWGSMVAMQYAMKYSDNINRMVLMSSMGIRAEYFGHYLTNIEKNRTSEDSLALEKIAETDGFKNRLPETMEKFWRVYFKAYCYNPDLVDSLQLWMRDSTYKQVPGRYANLGKFMRSYDIEDDLKKITCPTLILYGDYDPTPVEWVKPIHDNIAGSKMAIIKNAGHWLWVEAPDRVTGLIREFFK